jgi:transcriptional regulator with XRE-family HTH domain
MIYKNIKEAAEKQKISINSLEDRISVSHGSICKWDRNRPSVDKVLAVAEILGVSIYDLMKEE